MARNRRPYNYVGIQIIARNTIGSGNQVVGMSLDTNEVDAITFDSFSTLVDPHSAQEVIEDLVDDPGSLVSEWHPLAVQYATVANVIDEYSTYFELHRAALDDLLRNRGCVLSDEELARLTNVYHQLEPFDDVEWSFGQLTSTDFTLAILSNGDPEMLESLIVTTGIDSLVSATISADEIQIFKPDKRLYLHAADRLDVNPEWIVHVGAGWGDVLGANNAGFQTVWVNRCNRPWRSFGPEPDLQVPSLSNLVTEFRT